MDVLERALTAAQHKEPDKVPFVPLVYSMIFKDYKRQTEEEYYHDFRTQLEAKIAFQRRFPELMGPPACHFCFPEAPHNIGGVATAFGGKISWMRDAPPWVSECPVKEPEDVDRLVSAGVPDPRKTGMTAKFLEGLRYFSDWFPRDLRTRYGYIDGNTGPDCMLVEGAAVAMGYDKFLVWLFLHPKEVHRWLRLVTDWYLELCEAVGEITGHPKYLWVPDHSPSFVGMEQFKEFVLPHFNEVLGKYKRVAREGGWRVWHCEGSCQHNLEGIDLIDAEVWHFGALDDPALCKEKTPAPAKVVIGTVQGDLHDIGKNIVIALLRAAGFEVYDIGVDAPASKFVQKVEETGADTVGLSALLASTAPYFKDVVTAFEKAGLRDRVHIMIGGPHATEAFAEEVGADVSCKDAIAGVDRARDYAEKLKTKRTR